MTIEDLEEQGVLLPEEEWGVHELETTTPEVPLALAFVAALGFWMMIYMGDGRLLTWVGTGLFLATLYGITWICDRAVLRQREKFREERGRAGTDGDDEGREATRER